MIKIKVDDISTVTLAGICRDGSVFMISDDDDAIDFDSIEDLEKLVERLKDVRWWMIF